MGKYRNSDKLAVYDVMLNRMKEMLSAGKTVIVDGTFYQQQLRDSFIAAARAHTNRVALVCCTADEAVIRQRVSKKRPDSEADFEVYQKIRDSNEPLTTDHLVLKTDEGSEDELIGQVLHYIKTIPQ